MSEKYYTLGTHTSEQWAELHAELTADGNVYESVPSRQVTIVDDRLHSPTRGDYLLTEEEANALKNDERVKVINLSLDKHKDAYDYDPDDLKCVTNNTLTDRWPTAYKNYQKWWYSHGNQFGVTKLNFDLLDNQPTLEPTINRTTALYRMSASIQNPWKTTNTDTQNPISGKIQQVGAGENVDIICADNGCWIGHTEFINSGVTNAVNPSDYVGGNVLPGNGYCDVLDLVLDAPYYIDPDWFNASASTRLMTRWDGTTVPVESVARSWWQNTSQRSSSFAAFGSVSVSNSYTRDKVHGSNTKTPRVFDVSTTPGVPVKRKVGDHGTQCASLIYGRTHGWAYNANKWHLNLYGYSSVGSIEVGFDVQKIFHQYKPVNSLYNTKDPTMSSNSWGLRKSKSGTHYHFRNSGAVAYGGSTAEPGFISWLGIKGDSGNWKSEIYDNSMTVAGDELAAAGVIIIAAAGNSNQQQVNPTHPNYDNRVSNNNTNTFYQDQFTELASFASTGSTNRRGFPQHIGKTESQTSQGNTTVKFPAINIGVLDDSFTSIGTGKERKASYSDCGDAIDMYAPGDGVVAASRPEYQELWLNNSDGDNDPNTGGLPQDGQYIYSRLDETRVDTSYNGLAAVETYSYATATKGSDGNAMNGETAFNKTFSGATDRRFGGTSAACPIACGFLAIVMQYNRGWDYEDLRDWIQNNLQTQSASDFYEGTEATTATANWSSDYHAIQGSQRRVLYQATIPVSTAFPTNASAPDTTVPVITILGNNPATVELGASYTDAGATAMDAVDGTRTVTSTGTVNTSTVGSYTIAYSATDNSGNTGYANRTVNVVDTTAPIVTVTGTNPITVELGASYTDSGATANGSETVTTTGSVNTSVVGTYTLTYTATDASGNTGTATRTVNVVDTTAPIITSSNIASSINEGITGLGTVTANETVTWSISGTGVSISTSGVVTLDSAADYEIATSHSFVITATDSESNSSNTGTLTVAVVDTADDGNDGEYDGPLVINVILGATVNTATEEAGDSFFSGNTNTGQVITRLPPVYANDGYSVSLNFQALGGSDETWTIDNISVNPNSNFNYNISSPAATITQQNDPYTTQWSCLMGDYSTQTFSSETAASAAADPSLLELISLTTPNPTLNEETHTFSVTLSEAGGTNQVRAVDIDQAKHFDAQSFISKVQSII